MSTPFSFGKVQIDVGAGKEATHPVPKESKTFRVLVLGDFSGRTNRGSRDAAMSQRRPLAVDRDNFEQVMAKLGVELRLPLERADGPFTPLRFRELDDFRPERLLAQVELFDKLKETRRRLSDPATFAEAAKALTGGSKPAAPPVPPSPLAPRPSPLAGATLLEQILGETGRIETPPTMPGGEDWSQFLQKIVASHLVPQEEPLQAELIAQVDKATGALMRAILHHPEFRALESAWRGLYFLVRRLDTDGPLKLFLLDVSKAELAGDLAATENLNETGTYRLLVEQTVGTPGALPWSLLVGNYSFGPGRSDVEMLGRLAKIARSAGAPFLAAASPAVLGCASLARTPDPNDWKNLDAESEETWNALRDLAESSYLGLVLPRFLLRLPYGKDTDPIEAFPFEEMTEAIPHESYLWGNPAIACAYLLGESFLRFGREMRANLLQDIDGLPLHVFTRDGESEMKPCAEALLTDRAVARFLDKGVMPLLSVPGSDRVRLAAFRSVSRSATLKLP